MSSRPSCAASLALILVAAYAVGCQSDPPTSNLTIKVNNGSFRVAGLVHSQEVRNAILAIIKRELSVHVPSEVILVNQWARPLGLGWEVRLARGLRDVRSWKSGMYNFTLDSTFERSALYKRLSAAKVVDIDGGEAANMLGDGKILIAVTLFATWASPARKELALLQELYAKYAGKGFDVVAINVDDESITDTKVFKRSLGLTFRLALGRKQLADQILEVSRFQGIPQTFLIEDGRILAIFRGSSSSEQGKLRQIVESRFASIK